MRGLHLPRSQRMALHSECKVAPKSLRQVCVGWCIYYMLLVVCTLVVATGCSFQGNGYHWHQECLCRPGCHAWLCRPMLCAPCLLLHVHTYHCTFQRLTIAVHCCVSGQYYRVSTTAARVVQEGCRVVGPTSYMQAYEMS